MKLYKKTAAVLTAFVIGVVPFFAEAPLAYDSELSVYDSSAPDKDKEGCYEIYTADQLAWLAVRCNVDHETDFKAKIMQDIEFNPGEVNSKDESRRKWTPIGSGDVNFVGEIDGQGHKITGLYCTGGKLAGLVGYNHGIIKNLGIENSYIFSTTDSSELAYSGSFAAVTKDGGYIENCYSNARVGSNYISGGLCGVIGGSANLKN